MLNEQIKRIDILKKKIDDQITKYENSRKEAIDLAENFKNRVDGLKSRSKAIKGDLDLEIEKLNAEISKKIMEDPFQEGNSDNDAAIRELSLKLDLLNRKKDVISKDLRQSIIFNCKKEIEKAKEVITDNIIQARVLHGLYRECSKIATSVIADMNKLLLDLANVGPYNMSNIQREYMNNGGLTDNFKPVAEYLLNMEFSEPGELNPEHITAHDGMYQYFTDNNINQIANEKANAILAKIL